MDLEWNGTYSEEEGKYFNEVIEIGAVKLDENFNEIEQYSTMIKPKISCKLTDIVKKLTNLTDEDLENGSTFQRTVEELCEFVGDDGIVITWSDTDLHILIENCKVFFGTDTVPFVKRYLDLQKVFGSEPDRDGIQPSLIECAGEVGIDVHEYSLHRALDDSLLCAEVLRRSRDHKNLYDFMIDTTQNNFYERFNFKSYFICDITSREIDRRELKCACKQCGKTAKRVSPFHVKNSAFFAQFYCSDCDREYFMRIRFKKLYDGVKVNKAVFDASKRENNENALELK